MGRILVVEDEEGVREFLCEALELDGHDVVAAAGVGAALATMRESAFDVVLTDLRMPDGDGMAVVRASRTEQPDVEVIVLTAFGAVASAVEAMRLGAFDYAEKPIASPAALRSLVAGALGRRAALVGQGKDGRGAPADDGSSPLTWRAPAMRPVVDALERVAPTDATVLLLGESGTGKEVAAHAIHRRSPRRDGPFVAISCAVLAENLLESELFGHEKGAFTGAHALRRGRLELADGGTFFLDEVGELALPLQAKLLRAIEERSFERLGSAKPITVDVRFIAATHRDLRAMVASGRFREDLYHRLSVFPLRLPPLRERREDIVPLAETLLDAIAAKNGRRRPRLTPAAAAAIEGARWSGNARELRNALERAVILTDGDRIEPTAFALDDEHVAADDAHRSDASASSRPASGAHESLETMERKAIERALAAVSGNRKAAAERLGIGLRTLYEKLKRYDLR
jgi:two-component system response regulator AtoC